MFNFSFWPVAVFFFFFYVTWYLLLAWLRENELASFRIGVVSKETGTPFEIACNTLTTPDRPRQRKENKKKKRHPAPVQKTEMLPTVHQRTHKLTTVSNILLQN